MWSLLLSEVLLSVRDKEECDFSAHGPHFSAAEYTDDKFKYLIPAMPTYVHSNSLKCSAK